MSVVRPFAWHVALALGLVVTPMVYLVVVTVTYTPPKGPPAPPGQARTLEILEPLPGAIVQGPQVVVRIALDGELARLQDVPTNNAEGLVHAHVQLDGGAFDNPEHSDSPLITRENSAGSYSGMIADRLTYRKLPPGPHELRVELVANDHTPSSGVASATTRFVVE